MAAVVLVAQGFMAMIGDHMFAGFGAAASDPLDARFRDACQQVGCC